LVRWCEWDTRLPKDGFFPQISQTAAMAPKGSRHFPRAWLGPQPAWLPGRMRSIPFERAAAVSGPCQVMAMRPLAS
jgi:hypothetical protein